MDIRSFFSNDEFGMEKIMIEVQTKEELVGSAACKLSCFILRTYKKLTMMT